MSEWEIIIDVSLAVWARLKFGNDSIQQIMRSGVGLHQGITAAVSSSLSSASASTLQGTGGFMSKVEPNTETMSTFESH